MGKKAGINWALENGTVPSPSEIDPKLLLHVLGKLTTKRREILVEIYEAGEQGVDWRSHAAMYRALEGEGLVRFAQGRRKRGRAKLTDLGWELTKKHLVLGESP